MNSLITFLKKEKNFVLSLVSLILLFSLGLYISRKDKPEVLSSTEALMEVQLNVSPPLDFSIFAPYVVSATSVPGNPSGVKLNLSVDMGDENECWDFEADGTCASEPISLNMTYDPDSNSYKKNIYPDQIYPEIFFATSNVTRGNQPLETTVRRNDYHILHLANPFDMVSDMSFWVEVNATPFSTVNSADLQVYLVGNNQDISYFNSDWINGAETELIGTITKSASFHHTHSVNSSHHLVRLTTDSNGNVGNKNLDISEDFWIVLYSNSPNNNRGWNLRYQPNSLCQNSNRWYRGNITGWSTSGQAGCPDMHIHISRRNENVTDTIKASVSATYDTGTFTSPLTTFSFIELPNLPPNATSFTSPIVGSKYRGDLNIQWNPATDPNPGNTLTYDIYLTPFGGTQSTLISNTSNTSYLLDTTSLDDGEYSLEGQVCDSTSLCTAFAIDGSFFIDNIIIPETISQIDITSSNSNTGWAREDDIISIQFQASGGIATPNVDITSGGDTVTNLVSISLIDSQQYIWEASYQVSLMDSSGQVTFEISSPDLDKIYYKTTDNTNVVVDLIPPSIPTTSLASGTYLGQQVLTLVSEDSTTIRYSTDESTINCNTGVIYNSSITISSSLTLKAIACDLLGNSSEISSNEYFIKESLSSISISSSNSTTSYARVGDTVTLTFTATNSIDTPTVIFRINSIPILGDVLIENISGFYWRAVFVVQDDDQNGPLSFVITSSSLYSPFSQTTNSSSIIIDTVPPTTPLSNIPMGSYAISRSITLVSSMHSIIRYTLDGSNPSCISGSLYISPISISSSKILSAISCDSAGNYSAILRLPIKIFPDTVIIDYFIPKEDVEEEIPLDMKFTYSTIVIKENDLTILSVFRVRILNQEFEPLSNIDVTLFSEPQNAETDDDGIANFYYVPIGSHDIVFSYNNNAYQEEIEIKGEYEEGLNNISVLDVITDIVEEEIEKESTSKEYTPYTILGSSALLLFLTLLLLKRRKLIDKKSY